MPRSSDVGKVALVVALALGLGCDEGPLAPRSGTLVVAVYDGGDSDLPVPDVAITVTPVGRHGTTGDNGTVTFQLAPGGYYVDADVCCIGPGSIHYHQPVALEAGRTTSVTLDACLACVQLVVSDPGTKPGQH